MTSLTISGLVYLWVVLTCVVDVIYDMCQGGDPTKRIPFYDKTGPHWWNPMLVSGLLTYLWYLLQP